MNVRLLILSGALAFSAGAYADDSTLDAAIGGAVGAAVGNEVGGRDGAILGGAIGAAIGTADSHSRDNTRSAPEGERRYRVRNENRAHPQYHCPPGQAKKGNC